MKHKLAIAVLLVFALLASALPALADEPTDVAGPSSPGRQYAGKVIPAGPENARLSEADTARLAHQAKSQNVSPLGIEQAYADGRVYNVTAAVNIRSCAGVGCTRLSVAYPGADLENDASGGMPYADGYYWVRVVYSYASGACSTTKSVGWVIVDPLQGGNPHVTAGPLYIRSSPCTGSIITSVPAGTTLTFYQGDNQWSNKWYEVYVPGTYSAGWVDGWDYTDVY